LTGALRTLEELGLVRLWGGVVELKLGPLKGCIEELIQLAEQQGKLEYASNMLAERPVEVASNIAAYCLIKSVAETELELKPRQLEKLARLYLMLLLETGADLYVAQMTREAIRSRLHRKFVEQRRRGESG